MKMAHILEVQEFGEKYRISRVSEDQAELKRSEGKAKEEQELEQAVCVM